MSAPTGTLLLSQIRHNHQQALVRDFTQPTGARGSCRHPAQKQRLDDLVEFAGKVFVPCGGPRHAAHYLPVGVIVQTVKLEESVVENKSTKIEIRPNKSVLEKN